MQGRLGQDREAEPIEMSRREEEGEERERQRQTESRERPEGARPGGG
jgi:hypothetical protein